MLVPRNKRSKGEKNAASGIIDERRLHRIARQRRAKALRSQRRNGEKQRPRVTKRLVFDDREYFAVIRRSHADTFSETKDVTDASRKKRYRTGNIASLSLKRLPNARDFERENAVRLGEINSEARES